MINDIKKECFGKRFESYDKCETCTVIEECSFITLSEFLEKEDIEVDIIR